MKIVIVIVADLIIAAISMFAASETFGLRRYKSFTVPYTDQMIAKGILPKESREALLREDKISHIIGVVIGVLACLVMSRFMAGVTGLIAFAAVYCGANLFVKADMTETAATREGYFRAHKAQLDPQKYAAYIQELQNR